MSAGLAGGMGWQGLASSGGGAPSGPAGGDLGGTYPNPTVVALHTGATQLTIGTITDGAILKRSGTTIAPAIAGTDYVAATTQVIAGTGLAGGGALSGNVTLSLPTVGPGAGLIGGAGIASVTLDAQGRVTAVATASYVLTPSFTLAQIYAAGASNADSTMVLDATRGAPTLDATALADGVTGFFVKGNSTKKGGVAIFGGTARFDGPGSNDFPDIGFVGSNYDGTGILGSTPTGSFDLVGGTGAGSTGTTIMRIVGNGDNNVLIGTTTNVSSTRLRVVGTKTSAATSSWNAVEFGASTLTLSTTTTIAEESFLQVRAPTITAGTANTITSASTLTIAGPPTAGGSVTFTNAYAVWVKAGNVVLADGGATTFGSTASGGNMTLGTTVNATKGLFNFGATPTLILSENLTFASGASATLNVVNHPATTVVVSGSTNITTATGFNYAVFAAPTLSAASALTITNAATVTITGAPIAGGAGPATITNGYALWTQSGNVLLSGSLSGGDVITTVSNTSNTATSRAVVQASVGGSTASDPVFQSIVSGVTTWSFGIANATTSPDVDQFAFCRGTTLVAPFVFRIHGSAAGSGAICDLGDDSQSGSTDFRIRGQTGANVQQSFYINGSLQTQFTQFSTTAFAINGPAGTQFLQVYSASGNLVMGPTGSPPADVASTKLRVDVSKTVASATSAVWNGADYIAATLTLSGSTAITTSTGVNAFVFRAPSLSAGSALTVTNAATVAISGAPTGAGAGPATITNAMALWVQAGLTRLDGTWQVGASMMSANGAVVTTLTGVGPTGSNTSVQEWLTFKNSAGTTRYVPCF